MNTTLNEIPDIVAALQAGRAVDAERLCRDSLQRIPDDTDTLLLLALALGAQRRQEEAVAVHAKLTELLPGSALHWGNYATVLREAGRLDEAAVACDTALRLAPDDAAQWVNRSMLQLEQKNFEGARDAMLRVLELDPRSPETIVRAARACAICRDYRAEELIRPWREWLPLEDDLQLELADLHQSLGDGRTAQFLLEDLCARSPRNVPAAVLLAGVYERVNDLDAAQSLQESLLRHPEALSAANLQDLTHLRATMATRRGDGTLARRILEQAGPRNPGDYAHYFDLAGVCDRLNDSAAAMRALDTAHRLQVDELRQTVPHRFEPGAPILPAAVGRVSAEDYLKWPQLLAPAVAESPIFIVGFPRSGTTLLEQMLDAHPSLQSMDERPFFNVLANRLDDHGISVPQDLHQLDQHACDELRKDYLQLVCTKIARRWDAQLVDKNPLNMLWLPLIHRIFPRAKFILALRHPCDVLISNYMQNYKASVLAAACASLPQLAAAYVTAMECWLHHVEVFQPNVLVSRYEELVADPGAHAQRIAEFLGVRDPSPMLRFDQHARDKGYIATPSYTQVIQPVNRKGLDRWKRYREEFSAVLPVLEPMLQHWGYAGEPGG